MQFLFFFIKVWGFIIVLFVLYRVNEFFKMLTFVNVSFFHFIKLNKQEKTELLLAGLNSAEIHNKIKYKFVLADFERLKNYSDNKEVPRNLLNDLDSLNHRIQKIVNHDMEIKRWRKMFFAVID